MLLARLLVILAASYSVSSSPATFEELSARATAAREANNLPEAVKLYREALQLNPKWEEGWWFLGTILYDQDQYSGCRDALGRLVQLKADAAPALAILGLCEFQTGELPNSLAHIERSLAIGSSIEPAMEKVLRFHEAMLITRAGNFDQAIQKYAWFVRGPGPSNVLLTGLGLAALRAPLLPKDVPAAQEDLYVTAGTAAFSQMAGDKDGSQRNFRTLLERYPTAHHVHYLYACSLLASDSGQAVQELKRELENTPTSSGALSMLAWALLNQGAAKDALPYAERAAKNEPAYPLAQYVLGRSLVESGDVERGISHLELAAKSDPANLENHLALAAAYPKARRYQDARRERQMSLEMTREANAAAQR